MLHLYKILVLLKAVGPPKLRSITRRKDEVHTYLVLLQVVIMLIVNRLLRERQGQSNYY